jgi:predicted nucleic acid-binding protein
MPARVVDASALAAVLFGEPAGERVANVLGDGPLFVPTLMRYEVGSVCLKKIHRYPERRADFLAALALLLRMDLQEVEIPTVESATTRAETVVQERAAFLSAALGGRSLSMVH